MKCPSCSVEIEESKVIHDIGQCPHCQMWICTKHKAVLISDEYGYFCPIGVKLNETKTIR